MALTPVTDRVAVEPLPLLLPWCLLPHLGNKNINLNFMDFSAAKCPKCKMYHLFFLNLIEKLHTVSDSTYTHNFDRQSYFRFPARWWPCPSPSETLLRGRCRWLRTNWCPAAPRRHLMPKMHMHRVFVLTDDWTRMPSSRMRTVRWGGGCLPGGGSAQGGGYLPRGCLPRGCLPKGGYMSQCLLGSGCSKD